MFFNCLLLDQIRFIIDGYYCYLMLPVPYWYHNINKRKELDQFIFLLFGPKSYKQNLIIVFVSSFESQYGF
jgi:hypothetical protein